MKQPHFLQLDLNLQKLKVYRIFFVGFFFSQSGIRTVKLTVSEEWTDGRTNVLHVDTDSQKLKADQ